MKNNIIITANLDELSHDLKIAGNFFIKNNLKFVEIRTINNKNIVDFNTKEIDALNKYLKKNNLKVAAIASPLFKWYLNDTRGKEKFDTFSFNPNLSNKQKKEYILKTLNIAMRLDASIVRVFSNIKTEEVNINDFYNDECFKFAINEAEKKNITLAIENEPICIVKSKKDLRLITKKYKNLKLWFDISNFYQINEPVTRKDFEFFKDKIVYFHLKDFMYKSSQKGYRSYGEGYVPVGEGSINYERILSDIKSIFRNRIFLSLETHIKTDKINATQKSLNNLELLVNNKRVSYAVIGLGRISIKHLNAIKHNSNSELIGVYDLIDKKTQNVSRGYDCYPYSSLTELLNDEQVDVVNICTPHDTHYSLAIKVVNKNKKVLCEKPFVISSEKMNEALMNNDIKENVYVVMQYNFNVAVKYLYKMIDLNKLGNIKYFTINIRWWRDADYFSDWHGSEKRSGGSLYNQAIHSIDILNRILDLKPKSISTLTKNIYNKSKTEDSVISIVELKNGIIGNIEVFLGSKFKNFESSLFLSGEKGSIKIGGRSLNEISYIDIKGTNAKPGEAESIDVYGNGHAKLIQTLSNQLLGKKDNDLDLLTRAEDMQNTISFINAIYKSANK